MKSPQTMSAFAAKVLLLVVLAPFAFWITRLAASEPLWLDELTSYRFSNVATPAEVLERMLLRGDPHPPAYQLVLHGWMQLVGSSSALAIRSLSIVSWLVTVAALAWLLLRITSDWTIVVLSAPLYSAASSTLYFSVELRSYAFQQAALLAVLLGRDLLSHQAGLTKARRFLVYTTTFVAAVLAATSHYVATIAIASLAALDLARGLLKRSPRATLLAPASWLLGPVVAAMWLAYAAQHGGFDRTLDTPSASRILLYMKSNVGKAWLNAIGVSFGLLSAGYVGARIASTDRSEFRAPSTPWLHRLDRLGAPAMLLAVVLIIAISFFKPILQARNLAFIVPICCGVLALVAERLCGWSKFRAVAIALAVALLVRVGWSDARAQLAAPGRREVDLHRLITLSRRFTVVTRDDLANKFDDTTRIGLWDRQRPKALDLWYLEAKLGGERIADASRIPAGLSLACPRCTSKSEGELEQFAARAGLRCKRVRGTARSDKLFDCHH